MSADPHFIGRYRVLERLGSGGFGTVYAAERNDAIRQRVAVKVLRTGINSAEVLSRFQLERQALAMMDHPNIARVMEAGDAASGAPFVAMEFVDGPSITNYCESNELGTSDRLALFVDVCHGVRHAHQRGVIHRDLKPSNVLVGGSKDRPTPKIIDFGLAKALDTSGADEPSLTANGMILGTPEYMSPEQAAPQHAAIDTRTDVYSLGVLLYELLTGSLPFAADYLRSKSPGEVERILREEDPPTPSVRVSSVHAEAPHSRLASTSVRLAKRLTGDLDWVTMKALRKDPAHRYESVSALAADIQRHLRHETVQARPPGARYRTSRFLRRYRSQVIAAGVLFTALSVALIATQWSRARVDSARQREAAAQALERQATDPLRIETLLARAQSPWPETFDVERESLQWQQWLTEADDLLSRAKRYVRASEAVGATARGTREDTLRNLVRRLPELREWRADVAARTSILQRHAPLWARCTASLGGTHGFEGLSREPIPGLLPLGIDRDRSRGTDVQGPPLWVFAVGGTGELPRWIDEHGSDVPFGEPGRAVIDVDTAVLMVLLPGGSSWSGAQFSNPESPHYEVPINGATPQNEQPVHRANLRPFFMAKCEVTGEQYTRFMRANGRPEPDYFGHHRVDGPGRPVVGIESSEAAAFCEWLGLRLPSETEWEYACRAGTTTRFWFGDDPDDLVRIAWHGVRPEQGGHPHRVAMAPCGEPMPNPWGLHDMHGNAEEFCADDYSPTHEGTATDGTPRRGGDLGSVRRGGSWHGDDWRCRSAARSFDQRHGQDCRGEQQGFRPAREFQ